MLNILEIIVNIGTADLRNEIMRTKTVQFLWCQALVFIAMNNT